jgi:GT2 family glycosyltransferase
MGLLVGMNTAVIRRSVYAQIGGFDESMPIGEDYDFWLRASRVAPMHSLNGPVALYRIHPASAMHKVAKDNHMARLLVCGDIRWGLANPDQSVLDRKLFQRRIAMAHFDHGYLHFWRGDIAIARISFAKAFRHGGRRLRSAVYWLLAVGATLLPRSEKMAM